VKCGRAENGAVIESDVIAMITLVNARRLGTGEALDCHCAPTSPAPESYHNPCSPRLTRTGFDGQDGPPRARCHVTIQTLAIGWPPYQMHGANVVGPPHIKYVSLED